jgi:hypothetical protein
VEDLPQVTGIVLYNPLSTKVFEFPTFVQTAVWTRSPHEGRPVNEEISYNSAEGMVFTADSHSPIGCSLKRCQPSM